MIRKKIGKNFIFHSNSSINPNQIKKFLTYYQDILIKWGKNFLSFPSLPSFVASQYFWHSKVIFISSLSAKGINFVGQLFQNNQQLKKWDELKTEFDLIKNGKFLILLITHALPILWKDIL